MIKVLLILAICFNTADSWAGKILFKNAIGLTPGKTTKQRLTQLFGKPDKINNFKDARARQSWEYRENGTERITFFFDEGSEVAHSLVWEMRSDDPEKDLKVAKAQFPSATWEIESTKWINPHALPAECFYKDKKQGISLELNLRRREVYRITRWNPERALASEEGSKPPMFCLDAGCSPAIPASEFFKDNSVEKYCDEVH